MVVMVVLLGHRRAGCDNMYLGNHPISVNLEDVAEGREVDLGVLGVLVVHIVHADGNSWLSGGADEDVLLGFALFEPLRDLLHVFLVLLLPLLVVLHGRPHVTRVELR
jgi:hypothetical protein